MMMAIYDDDVAVVLVSGPVSLLLSLSYSGGSDADHISDRDNLRET